MEVPYHGGIESGKVNKKIGKVKFSIRFKWYNNIRLLTQQVSPVPYGLNFRQYNTCIGSSFLIETKGNEALLYHLPL